MSMAQDVRYAARTLARRPALVVVTSLALTIGIAANAIVFGVIDQLLLSPPPGVSDAESVRRIFYETRHEGREAFTGPVSSYPIVTAMREHVPAFEQVSAVYTHGFTLGAGPDARSVDVQLVSANYFELLRVRPQLGRAFMAEEDVPPRGALVAVISDNFWRQQGGSRDIIGQTLQIDGKPLTIIGVAPPGFVGVERRNVDLWVPTSALASDAITNSWHQTSNYFWVTAIARVRDGTSPALAEQQASTAYQVELARNERPGRKREGRVHLGPLVEGWSPGGLSAEGRVSLWLMAVSVIVLIIACANVANLLTARTLQRRREIAVRIALGVSRARLARQLLLEAALLALVAGSASVVVAFWGGQFVKRTLLPGIVWSNELFDARVLAITLAAAVICILLAGLAPAVQGMRTSVSDGLKSSARQVAQNGGWMRHALLGVQAALSLLLLIGAGLFVKSLGKVTGRDVGIDLDRVSLVSVDLERTGMPPERQRQLWTDALARTRALPGVESASLVGTTVPMRSASAMSFEVPGAARAEFTGGGPYHAVVTADYFRTLGTRIIEGRAFTEAEERVPTRTMLINAEIARSYWPGQSAVGKCAKLGDDATCTEIVGVVENVMLFSLIRDDRALLYLPPNHPMAKSELPAAMLVRTTGEASRSVALLRREIATLAPNMPFVSVSPYAQLVNPQLQSWRLGATMFALFGGIALLIAAVGLYSVMAYWVSQRTHEIGIRLALGARRNDIVRLVARQGTAALVVGLVAGVAAALGASRWIAGMLYETSARDPLVYGVAALVLLAAGVLASVIPTRRSTAVDPVIALRAD